MIVSAPKRVTRGTPMTVGARGDVVAARLMRPGAPTHTTDVEQRTIALTLQREGSSLRLGVPPQKTIVPPGYYMLFLVNAQGVPSVAHWVRVP